MSEYQYKTIIIDDEPPALERLKHLLGQFPMVFKIVGEAENGRVAINLIEELQPDLIFLDIQMPGMTGFEMLSKLKEIPRVVFCTAYDQYSLQAFETNSVDYLLKPVKLERLEQTIAKLELFGRNTQPAKILDLLEKISSESKKKEMSSIAVKSKGSIVFIKLNEVAYFKAGDKYVSLFLKNGEEKITEQTIIQLKNELPESFFQVHRSTIINTNFVEQVQPYFNSRYSIQLNDFYKTKIISGRSYQPEIRKWMGL